MYKRQTLYKAIVKEIHNQTQIKTLSKLFIAKRKKIETMQLQIQRIKQKYLAESYIHVLVYFKYLHIIY